tara:strand:- start:498 stop:815 length:318 start_codon:yes stop_codon:yes gene_type:complete
MKQLVYLLLISLAISHCNAQTGYFPPTNSDEWETLPIDSLNWCQDKVDAMVDFVGDNNSKAFIILKNGKIVVEEYQLSVSSLSGGIYTLQITSGTEVYSHKLILE